MISLRNGGQGAAITVISKYTFNTDGSTNLDHRLKDDAEGLAEDADVEAGVAGGAAPAHRLRRDHQGADPAAS